MRIIRLCVSIVRARRTVPSRFEILKFCLLRLFVSFRALISAAAVFWWYSCYCKLFVMPISNDTVLCFLDVRHSQELRNMRASFDDDPPDLRCGNQQLNGQCSWHYQGGPTNRIRLIQKLQWSKKFVELFFEKYDFGCSRSLRRSFWMVLASLYDSSNTSNAMCYGFDVKFLKLL